MKCNRIRIRNFRNIETADVSFDAGVNILAGQNAQGKTNLLEAIGYVSIGKSFRTAHDEEMIRLGEDCAEISLDFSDSIRDQNLTVRMMPGRRRRIEQNGVKLARVSDAVGIFRTVLFCPTHLSLIREGPGERRNFLDVALSQLHPVYLRSLQTYNRVLKQRNQLIRAAEENPAAFRDTVELWSRQLAHESAILSLYRSRYLQMIRPAVCECFHEMTAGREEPELVYLPSVEQPDGDFEDTRRVEESYFERLMTKHDREIGAGTTLWGAHKDDVEIRLNGAAARAYASQGQQRSLCLALKLAEGEVCRQVCGEVPAFLLDDVFSELDPGRRQYLAEKIVGRQVLITSCEPEKINAARVIRVENGTYTPEV